MGRTPIENKKVNKSGRFEPALLEDMEKSTVILDMNLSQTLEFFAEIGVLLTKPEVYTKLRAIAAKKRKDIPFTVEEIVKQYCDSFNFSA
jgi:hypothetical protein